MAGADAANADDTNCQNQSLAWFHDVLLHGIPRGARLTAQTARALLVGLRDPKPYVRSRVREILFDAVDPQRGACLIDSLDNGGPGVRMEIVRLLGYVSEPAALHGLIRCLFDAEPGIRQEAIGSLCSAEDAYLRACPEALNLPAPAPAGLKPLLGALEVLSYSKKRSEHAAIAELLGRGLLECWGPTVAAGPLAAMLAVLRHERRSDERQPQIELLGRLCGDIRQFRLRSRRRGWAIVAPDFAPVIVQSLLDLVWSEPAFPDPLVEPLLDTNLSEHVPELLDALGAPSVAVRCFALEALGTLIYKSVPAREAVLNARTDPSPEVQRALSRVFELRGLSRAEHAFEFRETWKEFAQTTIRRILAEESTPSTELISLTDRCKLFPEDNQLRLTLADLLERQGEAERAEFIRLQCHMHAYGRLSERTARVDRVRDREREQMIFSRNRSRWAGPLSPWIDFDHCHRGFFVLDRLLEDGVKRLACSTREERAWIDALRICFDSQREASLRCFVRIGAPLSGLVRLNLGADDPFFEGDPLPQYEIQALLALTHMPFLRRLSFANYEFAPDDIAALLEMPWFGQLTDLALTEGWSGRTLCRFLGAHRQPTSLVSLSIRDNRGGINDNAVETLLQTTSLTELRELDFSRDKSITDRTLRCLAESPLLKQLRFVTFSRCSVTPEGIESLRRRPEAKDLQIIDY